MHHWKGVSSELACGKDSKSNYIQVKPRAVQHFLKIIIIIIIIILEFSNKRCPRNRKYLPYRHEINKRCLYIDVWIQGYYLVFVTAVVALITSCLQLC